MCAKINKNIHFKNDLKDVTDSASLISSGREFHSWAALTAKTQSPFVLRMGLRNSQHNPAQRSKAAPWLIGEQQFSNLKTLWICAFCWRNSYVNNGDSCQQNNWSFMMTPITLYSPSYLLRSGNVKTLVQLLDNSSNPLHLEVKHSKHVTAPVCCPSGLLFSNVAQFISQQLIVTN